jgi:SH3-like domain-containing protein
MLIHLLTSSKTIKFFLFSFFLFFTLVVFLFQQETAEALCVKDKKANLRSGPGKHNEKLWTVLKYMPFRQIGREGKWLKVKDLDGDIYWIYRTITTKAYMCAVIKNHKTNLRQGPATKFPQVEWSPIDKYFSMKVLKIKGSWVHVEDSTGDRAWVHRSLVWIQ